MHLEIKILYQNEAFFSESDYTYDTNGNLIEDSGKKLEIKYTLLNLPYLVKEIAEGTGDVFTNKYMTIDYTFGGEKVKQI